VQKEALGLKCEVVLVIIRYSSQPRIIRYERGMSSVVHNVRGYSFYTKFA
jgi:hypothetical protein